MAVERAKERAGKRRKTTMSDRQLSDFMRKRDGKERSRSKRK